MDQQIIELFRSLGRHVIPSTMGVDILKPTPTLRIDSTFYEYGCHLVINPPTEEIEVEVLNARQSMSYPEAYASFRVAPEQLVLTPAQIKYFIEFHSDYITAGGCINPAKFLCRGKSELVVASVYLAEETVIRVSTYPASFGWQWHASGEHCPHHYVVPVIQ